MRRSTTVLVLAITLAMLRTVALAGPLATDPNAYNDGFVTWKGTALFTGTNNLGGSWTLKSNVDYAVFAPGMFTTSFPAATDPSGGTEFVYAYQVLNDGTGITPSNVLVLNLSVALTPGADPDGVTNAPGIPIGSTVPNLNQFITSGGVRRNAKWSYTTTLLNVNQYSDILLYTSPYGPQALQSAMQGGHSTGGANFLPSPVPEPATIALAIGAVICFAAARLVRKRAISK